MIRVEKIRMGGNAACSACKVNPDRAKVKWVPVLNVELEGRAFDAEFTLCMKCAPKFRERFDAAMAGEVKR